MKKFTIDQIIKILAEADTPGNSDIYWEADVTERSPGNASRNTVSIYVRTMGLG